ncbi:STAS/SEC14 domain-containing protein [Planococcus sp. ISL-109]|uniref:STAS/SEC14 domain-containing protein n=1 Tax=Planococcus sp. ISL-109 TaxID=2819166 RepID=UPI001BE924F9|nr:STAS/SEC14 domain-containing protein [Planococcus sp. ISL-109]MBT2581508.1 STAS/SEC14 domain-containing protein [Planococcus sp. ISL-109]
MLSIVPSKDEETIAIEVEGRASRADIEKLNHVIRDKVNEKGHFNMYAIIYQVEDSTLFEAADSAQIDRESWGRARKFAVISEKDWTSATQNWQNFAGELETRHFNLDEMNDAWDWMQE